MKKVKMMIPVLFVVLFVLIGCYFIVVDMQEKKAEEGLSSVVFITDVDDLTSVKYGSSDANTMSFVKKEDVWYYEADETISLEQSTMETMTNVFAYLTALRTLEQPDSLEDYGLEEPKYTLTLTDTEGNTTVVYVGDAVDGNYYVTVNDKDVVYVTESSIVDSMQFNLESLEAVEEETTEETTE